MPDRKLTGNIAPDRILIAGKWRLETVAIDGPVQIAGVSIPEIANRPCFPKLREK